MSPTKLARRMQIARDGFRRLCSRFAGTITAGASVLHIIVVIASVVCLTFLVVYGGYDHSPSDKLLIARTLRGCHIVFIVNVLYNYILRPRVTFRQTRIIKWIVDMAMLLSILPLIYPRPEHPWIPYLDTFLYGRAFGIATVASYAAFQLCYAIFRAVGKRTNPSILLSSSFLVLIILGSLVLMMPRCTVEGISYIDSLFVATSAVCITGLTTVDVSQVFTPTGLLVLAILIQTGGLGVMTFTSFFAIFFSGNSSIYSQLMVRDLVYSKSFSRLIPTLLYILGVTLVIEAAGAVAIFLSVHGTLSMSLHDEIIFSAFHSLSAFCNAGFSNIEGGLSNPALLSSNQSIYLIASALIMAGGIGFPILVNFKEAIGRYFTHLWHAVARRSVRVHRPSHIYDLNTKIVLCTTFTVFFLSALLFFCFEYDNTLRGMSLWDKIAQSIFNAWVPRSSGFSSVNPASMLDITIILFILLMWIGGSSQSTAGGIKVNTFATMLLNLRAVIRGRDRVTAFGRTIAVSSIRRAHAMVALSIISYAIFAIILVALEPHLSTRSLLYETASALFTVGSSLGVTPLLSTPSKVLLISAMFLGRVGLISLLSGIMGTHSDPPVTLPSDSVIIN